MLIVGTEYRIVSMKDGVGHREGTVIQADGPMFVLDVEGIQMVFHMANVAYAEVIDRAAEEARENARMEAWTEAYR